jgi:hypothetical protein
MTEQLGRRVDMITAAQDRSVQMLTEVAGAGGGIKTNPGTSATPAVSVTPVA